MAEDFKQDLIGRSLCENQAYINMSNHSQYSRILIDYDF